MKVKKIVIPVERNDEVLSVSLVGDGAENFQINTNGEVFLMTSLYLSMSCPDSRRT